MSSRRRTRMTTAALLGLLDSDRTEEVCAAALVLGSLDLADLRVVPAVRRALESAETPTRHYLLDALGRMRDPRAMRATASFLISEGALREQAVRLLIDNPDEVVPELRRVWKGVAPECPQSVVWVVANRPCPAGLDLVVEMLECAEFDGAKTIYLAIRSKAEGWKAGHRKYLAGRLLELLDELSEGTGNTTVEIGCMKLLSTLGDARAVTPLLARVDAGQVPVVRHNALDALAEIPLPARRRNTIGRKLEPLIHDDSQPRIALGALRVLRRLTPPGVDDATLICLADSPEPDLACLAIRELGRRGVVQAANVLIQCTLSPQASVHDAAAAALRGLPEATQALLAACEDARFTAGRESLLAVLAARGPDMDGKGFSRIARGLLDTAENAGALNARLQALGRIDRKALNRLIESRATRHFAAAQHEAAISLLEPLVRGRLAEPRGRYLLALLHFLVSADESANKDTHDTRTLHLLGPLAKLKDWHLGRHLARETRLSADQMQRMLGLLAGRSEAEHEVARYVAARLGLDLAT